MLTEVVRGLPSFFHANSGDVPQLGHDPFLPNPFQFIVHQSTLHSPNIGIIVK
jgi:hypothetical protein